MEKLDIENSTEVEAFKKFVSWVENFCDTKDLPGYNVSIDDVRYILEMKPEEAISLDAEECFANALLLLNYAGKIQKELDLLETQNNWCNEALNFLYAKHWKDHDPYLPADIRKQSIISGNSYATAINKSKLRIVSGIKMLTETCKDVKKRVTILQDMGKRKGFK